MLPLEAVANGTLPAIACYISSTGQTWLAVSQTPTQDGWPFCALVGIGTDSPGIRLINGPEGWRYWLMAVY